MNQNPSLLGAALWRWFQRIVLLLALLALPAALLAQGTAFNYSGRLTDGATPATGNYDITFTLYDADANGTAAGSSVTKPGVAVASGQFAVSLDFGPGVFNGNPRWLELSVRPSGNGPFTTLSPRQHLKPVPYAILAESAKSISGTFGTTTAQPLEFQVNNHLVLRLEHPDGRPPNLIGAAENNSVGAGVYGAFLGGGEGNSLGIESFHAAVVGGQMNIIQDNANHSIIGGGANHTISNLSAHAVIAGGLGNSLDGSSSAIGGGWGNRVFGGWATIAGGSANVAEGDGSTVAGGAGNQAKGGIASVGGGSGNLIDGAMGATISGGNGNEIKLHSAGAAVGGGYGNTITNAVFSVIAGGEKNHITPNGSGSAISGGSANVADANFSSILGGEGNLTEGIGGYATVLGGRNNRASGVASVAAGYRAAALNNGSFVWNGWNGSETTFGSLADGEFAVNAPGGVRFFTGAGRFMVNGRDIGSGVVASSGWSLSGNAGTTADNFLGTTDNKPLEFRVNNQHGLRLEPGVGGSVNFIGGARANSVASDAAGGTIGGGGTFATPNRVESTGGTIGGGMANLIRREAGNSVVGGGSGNTIMNSAAVAVIGGGDLNTAQSYSSTIGGGHNNLTGPDAQSATIAGGEQNSVDGRFTTIGGGQNNNILGNDASLVNSSTISGGHFNTIQANALTATIGGGSRNSIVANSQHGTIPGGFLNTATSHAFAAGRQAKAVHIGAFVWADSQEADFASAAPNQFAIRANGGAVIQGSGGFGNPQLQLTQTANDFARLRLANPSGSWDIAAGPDGSMRFFSGGSDRMVLNSGGLTVNGTLVSSSDRNVKENFEAINPEQILDKVAALPISQWNYKQDKSAKHIGPMAQDFHAAFGVGPDNKHIAVVDESGVALAAIQGLNQRLEKEVEAKGAQIEALEKRLADLEQAVRALSNHQ